MKSPGPGRGFGSLLFFAFAGEYPAHWWTPIIDAQKSDWEILPQAAKPGQVILSKRNELGILSNFAPTPFIFHGVRYASVEGFWQMMLYPESPDDARARSTIVTWPHTRSEVALMTAFEAKAAGDTGEANMRRMGIDWVSFQGRRMPYRSMNRRILLATGNLILLPDHIQETNAPPEWAYFTIWMGIRTELQRGRDRE